MPYTGNEAIAVVRQHLNTVAVDGNWVNAGILTDLNIANKKVARITPSDLLGPLAQVTTVTVTHVASPVIPTANLVSGLYKYVHMGLGQKDVAKTSLKRIQRLYEQNAIRPDTPTNASDETHFYAVHEKFLFFPRYSSDQNYTLRYVKQPNAIAADAVEMDCHDALSDTVCFLAARIALQQDGRWDAAVAVNSLLSGEINYLAKEFDVDTQKFAFPMLPGQPAKQETG